MIVLKVPAMKCEGCAATIERAIKALDSDAVVKADLEAKTVAVDTGAEAARISEAVRAAGYDNDVGIKA